MELRKELLESVNKYMERNLPKHEIKEIKKDGDLVKVNVYLYGNKNDIGEYILVEATTRSGKKVMRPAPDKYDYLSDPYLG
jgi:rRNA maturation protein Nop10